jgi:hypothetical protein
MDALAGIDQILAQHSTRCSSDGDCKIVDTSLPCQSSCGGAIVARDEMALRRDLDRYAAGICPTLPVNCGFGPSCAQVAGARCMDGTCRPVVAGMGQ